MAKVVFLAVLMMSGLAQAEDFICHGTGRFSSIRNKSVTLTWNTLNYQKILFEDENLRVQVNVDKANSDGSHYLGIEVLETDPRTHQVSLKGAKGALTDMVMYIEGVSSVITCMPIKASASLGLRF